ncbi:hypothetical protein OM076_17235 [Solirubrobacter ginsenosidimutans]|uniref:Uncharacterized protein n=1 Tax=Solirubrobacter ginsenosidimutans TaxID=490573 RepID=A0A9X3MS52_9ACTN|nr:hypothetical protein [Solirubrobacter ginsenosidimutans]MDA0162021.1 hypothetical protein [Solirubrobacter ginsenosidimutans]
MKIMPDGMGPGLHIPDHPTAGDFSDYEAAYVLVPIEFVEEFSAGLDPVEVESTLVSVGTLLRILSLNDSGCARAVQAYRTAPAGAAKIQALQAALDLLDSEIGPQLDRPSVPVAQPALPASPAVVDDGTWLSVTFKNLKTDREETVYASLLRHGLWNLGDSHPEDLNSLLMPEVREQLMADGASLAKQLPKRQPYFGKGMCYEVPSGRVYEVDKGDHFFPVSGPGVLKLVRERYMMLKAVLGVLRSPHADRVAKSVAPLELFETLGTRIEDLGTFLTQIRACGVHRDDDIDAVVARYIKPYACPSITDFLAELAGIVNQQRLWDAARASRDRRKDKAAEDRKRTEKQPSYG